MVSSMAALGPRLVDESVATLWHNEVRFFFSNAEQGLQLENKPGRGVNRIADLGVGKVFPDR